MREQVRSFGMLLCILFVGVPSLLLAQSPIISTVGIGPNAQEAGTSDPFPSPRFGRVVAISGRVAMASVPGDLATESNDFGRVAVFEQMKDGWHRTATLLGSGESGGDFGRAIDIAGNKAVITGTKAIYLYERRGRTWVKIGRAILESENAAFGENVELERGFIIARVYEPQSGTPISSVVHIYKEKTHPKKSMHNSKHESYGSESVRALRRIATIGPQDGSLSTSFGSDVAMDGHLLVVGAPNADTVPGSAYVYIHLGQHWLQIDRLMASDGTVGDGFGTSVAIRNGVIVVGAPNADLRREDDEGYGAPRGNVYVFLPHRRGWYESQQLNDPSNESVVRDLGHDVSIGRDLLAVRAPDLRGLIRREDRVLVYDWIGRSFQFPQEVARYEGYLPDIDMSRRRLIVSRLENAFYNYYVTGSATIYVFGRN